jgi:hypothetical protein
MPGAFAQLTFLNGRTSLCCPATGRPVHTLDAEFDPDRPQTPHLRFVVDWAGDVHAVNPATLPAHQGKYQRRLVGLPQEDQKDPERFEDLNALMAACVDVLPDSAIVFELSNPFTGSYAGEFAHFGFDMAIGEDLGLPATVQLVPVDQLP